jgi:hypothetical protein
MAQLTLTELQCIRKQDVVGKDEPVIKIAGIEVWTGKMGKGDTDSVNRSQRFDDVVKVELLEGTTRRRSCWTLGKSLKLLKAARRSLPRGLDITTSSGTTSPDPPSGPGRTYGPGRAPVRPCRARRSSPCARAYRRRCRRRDRPPALVASGPLGALPDHRQLALKHFHFRWNHSRSGGGSWRIRWVARCRGRGGGPR